MSQCLTQKEPVRHSLEINYLKTTTDAKLQRILAVNKKSKKNLILKNLIKNLFLNLI